MYITTNYLVCTRVAPAVVVVPVPVPTASTSTSTSTFTPNAQTLHNTLASQMVM